MEERASFPVFPTREHSGSEFPAKGAGRSASNTSLRSSFSDNIHERNGLKAFGIDQIDAAAAAQKARKSLIKSQCAILP